MLLKICHRILAPFYHAIGICYNFVYRACHVKKRYYLLLAGVCYFTGSVIHYEEAEQAKQVADTKDRLADLRGKVASYEEEKKGAEKIQQLSDLQQGIPRSKAWDGRRHEAAVQDSSALKDSWGTPLFLEQRGDRRFLCSSGKKGKGDCVYGVELPEPEARTMRTRG